MSTIDKIAAISAAGLTLAKGTIRSVDADGRVRVRPVLGELSGTPAGDVPCDVLEHVAAGGSPLAPGDSVLIGFALPIGPGIVLGRTGRALPEPTPQSESPASPEAPPARLHLTATEEITLECGGGTIRITSDGRVVIRGEHILTRAKGTQRIKGGSVAIN